MATLSAAHFVDSDISGGTSAAVSAWTSTSPNTQARAVAYPQDRTHLNTETVQILEDGVVSDTQVVSGGVVTTTGTVNHIGLGFTSTLKPSKLDIEGMGMTITKKITMAIISFYNTLGGKYGLTTSSMYDIPFSTTLFTGIKEMPFRGQYEREGDIIIQQTQPLPMLTRGLYLNLGAYDA